MYEYLGGEVEEDLEEFQEKQREELDEFLSNDNATMKDLREFMEMQKRDLEDFLCGDEEDEDEDDIRELIKNCVREVLAEEKGK